jgi:hypothetical protein
VLRNREVPQRITWDHDDEDDSDEADAASGTLADPEEEEAGAD